MYMWHVLHARVCVCMCVYVCVSRDIKQPYCPIGLVHLGGMSHVQETAIKVHEGTVKGHEHTRQELEHVSWYHL